MDAGMSVQLSQFEANLRRISAEADALRASILDSGVSAFAVTAQRYTPPAIGSARLPSVWFEDGVAADDPERPPRPYGRRIVRDLVIIARSRSRLAGWAGRLLRQGVRFSVTSGRGQNSPRRKPKFLADSAITAKADAHESNRGSLRAAWGLAFPSIGLAVPAAFRYLTAARPDMRNFSAASRTADSVTLENLHPDASGNWVPLMESKAYFAALKAMNARLESIAKKDQTA